MSFIRIKKYKLFFKEYHGEGPGTLMLSSSGLGPRQWDFLSALMKGRLSYALSYLHYPPSDFLNEGVEPDIDVDFLGAEKLLDLLIEKGGGPINVVGHSYGGFLALSLAKKYPDKIRRMVLFEPIAWGVLRLDSQDESLKKDFENLYQNLFYKGLLEENWLRFFIDFWNHQGFWDSLGTKKQNYWKSLYPKIYAEVKGLCLDDKGLSHWADLKHPIRILRGKNGPPAQNEVCKLLFKALKNSELIETVGGHMAPITHFQKVLPLFSNWL